MNLYAFLAKLAGIGLVAGTAVAMVKLVEKVWPKTGESDSNFEYIAVAGEFPPDAEDACADGCATGEDAASEAADRTAEPDDCTAEPDMENDTANYAAETNEANDAPAAADEPAAPAAAPVPATAPDTPNANPVDAPPAIPVTDPLKIADPADFQDWDGLGCQG